ncbi:toxin 3FTx-Lei1-like [Sphaeramia orbicularis]|uniref:toxin 3FTx-Lei1-like n=1 Tax=Sphaeramia orbicularis TaxID=375764 RepID=UPI0011812FD4|nr:toxin 3FTx-Lei1-like [Sphaeramia orbicularis]
MQLYSALILLVTLSAAHAITCYTCTVDDPTPCSRNSTCVKPLDICYSYSAAVKGEVRGCHRRDACRSPFYCCSQDLCNAAPPTAPTGLLPLLLSSAVLSLCLG